MKSAIYNGRYQMKFPDHIADWDAISGWEIQRFLSMELNLRSEDVLFDVGAEHGSQSAIYSTFVGGGQNMVLIEPTDNFWPNIRLTWEANELAVPRATYVGLVGDSKSETAPAVTLGGWPACADGPEQGAGGYKYLHEPGHSEVDKTTFDQLVEAIGPPTAITMDVEGAEMCVLRGAEQTLREHQPLVWVSIHPDMLKRDYNSSRMELLQFMDGLGYEAHNLQVDHEEHWAFSSVRRPFTAVSR